MVQSYRDYLQSLAWLKLSVQAKDYYHWKCAVCKWDYKKKGLPLHTHHYDYRNLGHEKIGRDLCCLCSDHHPKGAFSREKVKMWRTSYRWQKRISRLFRWLFQRRER